MVLLNQGLFYMQFELSRDPQVYENKVQFQVEYEEIL